MSSAELALVILLGPPFWLLCGIAGYWFGRWWRGRSQGK